MFAHLPLYVCVYVCFPSLLIVVFPMFFYFYFCVCANQRRRVGIRKCVFFCLPLTPILMVLQLGLSVDCGSLGTLSLCEFTDKFDSHLMIYFIYCVVLYVLLNQWGSDRGYEVYCITKKKCVFPRCLSPSYNWGIKATSKTYI